MNPAANQNKIKTYTETAQDILKYVITFSELVKYRAKEGFSALIERGWKSGSPGRDRTCDQSLNRRLLYR
jgi:hypothetical protein